MRHSLASACILALLAPAASHAQGAPELSFGLALTSNYIFRGTTQSDDRPALQGYVEGESGALYFGAWASTVRLDGDRAELNLYAGLRQSLGGLDLDLGYVRYLYDRSGDCCGEAMLLLGHPVGETARAGFGFYHDFDLDESWAEASGTAEIWGPVSFAATLGTDFGTLELDRGTKVGWSVGFVGSLTETTTVDLRLHDSNDDPARVAATVSLDF
jgi:uncharacterized protein (TIGR02001 family)